MVSAEVATVYRSGRKRYFTLKAACRAEARAIAFRVMRDNGDSEYDAYRPRVERVAAAMMRRYRRRLPHDR